MSCLHTLPASFFGAAPESMLKGNLGLFSSVTEELWPSTQGGALHNGRGIKQPAGGGEAKMACQDCSCAHITGLRGGEGRGGPVMC